jgi:uncharacterized protein (DUF3820 family)
VPDERFTAACGYVMLFGKHDGKTLARIGSNSEGLKYLDWLVGQDWVDGPLRENLQTYLRHPEIARQLDAAIED